MAENKDEARWIFVRSATGVRKYFTIRLVLQSPFIPCLALFPFTLKSRQEKTEHD